MSGNKILIIGGYPPPYGGISVHILRLYQQFAHYFDINVIDLYCDRYNHTSEENRFVFHCGNRKPFNLFRAMNYLKKNISNVSHFHVSAMGNFVVIGYLLLWSLNKEVKKLITIHSGSFTEHYAESSPFKKKLISTLIRKFDHVIVVNEEGSKLLKEMGISENKISVISAFLPPLKESSAEIKEEIDHLKRKSQKLLLVSGYALQYYGFHVVLDALDKYLKNNDLAVVFAFYSKYDPTYLKDLTDRLNNSYNFLIYKDLCPNDFSFLVSLIDIYVRPTDRDGDAVSLREAIYFGKQIIASDCVKRPSNVILFNTMNSESLKNAIDLAIKDPKSGIGQFNFNENREKLLSIYEKMLRSS